MQRNNFFKSREDTLEEKIVGERNADMADALANVRENFKPGATTTQDKFSYQDLFNSFEAYNRASKNQESNKFDKSNLISRQVIGYIQEPQHLEAKPNFRK